MKKIILALVLSVFALPLSAQGISASDSAILNRILTHNRQYRTTQAPFQHERIKKGVHQHKTGTFYCERVKPSKAGDIEAKIAMLYNNPVGDYYIITTTHLYNGLNGRHKKYNFKHITLMKLLGNAMAWAVNGDIYNLYDNFNVTFKLLIALVAERPVTEMLFQLLLFVFIFCLGKVDLRAAADLGAGGLIVVSQPHK